MRIIFILILLMILTACKNNSGRNEALISPLVTEVQQVEKHLNEEMKIRTVTFSHNPIGEVQIEYPYFEIMDDLIRNNANKHIYDMVIIPEYREFNNYHVHAKACSHYLIVT